MKKGNVFSKKEIDSIIEEVDTKLEEFIKEGKYKDVLLLMGNLGKYSLTNQIYILLQKKDATTVKGVKGWNLLGRRIKKGEKAIKIICPIKGRRKEDKDENEKETLYVKSYKPSYVFDISQTTGKELPSFDLNENTKVKEKELIINALCSLAKEQGYFVSYAIEELEQGCLGLCNHKEKKIIVRNGLSPVKEISTLIHECAHMLAHNPYKNDFKGITKLPSRDIKEVEAESIAVIVSSYLGLDTKEYSFSYIAGWAEGKISKFRKNLDVISFYARKIIDCIDGAYELSDKQNEMS